MPHSGLPEFQEWNIAAVRLLQGVVYSDDLTVWNALLTSQSVLESYLARLGLLLVVEEAEGLAYVRQADREELPEGYDRLPKLFRKTRLGYGVTLLCVLLREQLRRFEEEDVDNQRCVVEAAALIDQWRSFHSSSADEVRHRREFDAAMTKLAEFGFVRKFGDEPESWEIRRIVKARLPVSELENLKAQLQLASQRRSQLDQQSVSE